jgi:hypothetical protein
MSSTLEAHSGALIFSEHVKHARVHGDARHSLVLGEQEKNFAQHEVGNLAAYTAIVFNQVHELKKNARQICMALKLCKDAYVSAAREQDPERKYVGWNAFCKRNFSNLGLSERNIRAAVKTGGVLLELQEKNPETFDAIADLSRDALFVIGSAPQVAHEIGGILSQTPDAKFTAAQLKEMAGVLESSEQSVAEFKTRFEAVQGAKERAEASAAAMNERLASYETEIDRLTHLIEEKSSPQPAGALTDQELQEQKKALLKVQRQLAKANLELQKAQQDVHKYNEPHQVLASLSNDVSSMLSKYSQALVLRLTETSPTVQDKLDELAIQLRTLSDQLGRKPESKN